MSVLNNLIQNAIEACYRNDSYVNVRCFIQDNMVIFRIQDNGKGINEKEQSLIFEPGFTTKFNPETGQVSTGLGLAHIKILTEHLEGRVRLVNDVEGMTEFRLELPEGVIICKEDCDV
jgi:two-component system sensor histidine kinase YcbA